MNLSNIDSTTGTCTAEVTGDPVFSSFTAEKIIAQFDPTLNAWSIIASEKEAPFGRRQILTFTIPYQNNVTNKTYEIADSPKLNQVSSFYVQDVSGTYHNYQAISGSITVTVNITQNTLSATFELEAKNAGTKTVNLKQGKLNIAGLDLNETKTPFAAREFTLWQDSMTADITGSITNKYFSTSTLLYQTTSRMGPASIIMWSQQLTPVGRINRDHRLVISTYQSVGPGTYELGEGPQVSAIYFALDRGFNPYHAVAGQLELLETTTPGTVIGTCRGRLSGRFQGSNISDCIEVKNASFSIKGAP